MCREDSTSNSALDSMNSSSFFLCRPDRYFLDFNLEIGVRSCDIYASLNHLDPKLSSRDFLIDNHGWIYQLVFVSLVDFSR